jgi:hypothetical protein
MYDCGTVRIVVYEPTGGRALRYDFRCLHILLFAIFAGFCFFGFSYLVSRGESVAPLKFGVVTFGWLYGGNYLVSAIRTFRLIRKTVS